MDTLYLSPAQFGYGMDLCLDSNGNIALASEPYSLAQDAASAVKTFLGEVYFSTALGVGYWQQILGKFPFLELVRAQMIAQALTVPDVASAKVFFSSVSDRQLTGQIQVTSTSGVTSTAGF